MIRKNAYLFFHLFFTVARTFDNLPELNKLIKLNLTVIVKINCVKELVSWDFAKFNLCPMLLSLTSINAFITVFVKYLEYFHDNIS